MHITGFVSSVITKIAGDCLEAPLALAGSVIKLHAAIT